MYKKCTSNNKIFEVWKCFIEVWKCFIEDVVMTDLFITGKLHTHCIKNNNVHTSAFHFHQFQNLYKIKVILHAHKISCQILYFRLIYYFYENKIDSRNHAFLVIANKCSSTLCADALCPVLKYSWTWNCTCTVCNKIKKSFSLQF